MSVNEDLFDAIIKHQIYLQRLSNGTVGKVLALLRRSDARIIERLLSEDVSSLSRTRMEALLRDFRQIVEASYVDATGQLKIDLEALADYEGQYQLNLFQRTTPVTLNTVRPSAEQILAAVNSRPFQGRLLKDLYTDLPRSEFARLRNAIRGGFVEGLTTPQIVQSIRGTRAQGYKDGILEQSRRAVTTVVRTATNHTANTAREYVYERNSDLIKGVRWVSTLDGRTSAVCRARDGIVYDPGKGPRPPAHFNCRSSTAPIMKSWEDIGFDIDEVPAGSRASMNGQVPAETTYDAWLRKQSREFQDDVLGTRKADLFRGGLKMDRFVDRVGNELTLDQLRQRENDIWQRTAA